MRFLYIALVALLITGASLAADAPIKYEWISEEPPHVYYSADYGMPSLIYSSATVIKVEIYDEKCIMPHDFTVPKKWLSRIKRRVNSDNRRKIGECEVLGYVGFQDGSRAEYSYDVNGNVSLFFGEGDTRNGYYLISKR